MTTETKHEKGPAGPPPGMYDALLVMREYERS